MKRHWFSLAAVLVLLSQLFAGLPVPPSIGLAASGEAAPPPPVSPQEDAAAQVKAAIEQDLAVHQEEILAYVVYQVQVEQVQVSADGQWAYANLVLADPQTGEPLPSEAGLAFARLQGEQWVATLPSDPEWLELLMTAPADLISEEVRQVWLEMYTAEQANIPDAPLTGYLLPWRAGETVYLSRSVAHDQDIPSGSAHYSFDFYISGTMYPVHAAKGGTVWRFQYDVPTCYERHCDQAVGNYLVIRDDTTIPVSYQLYLHLAQDSIPPELRVVGAPVARGQFIAISDNTGQSWGHHLHFQVHTNPDSYWGYAVDITFNDVSINGGRPRRHDGVYDDFPWCWESDVCEQGQAAYVSQNVPPGDLAAPMGELVNLSDGELITTTTLALEGWAYDAESGVDFGEVIVNYNDTWQSTGLTFTSTLSATWDLCTPGAAVPNGPFSVALRIYDNDGNVAPMAGRTTVIKDAACPQPPPACVPAVDQVALFEDADFGSGCELLEVGDYPDSTGLGMVGNDDAASILVGSDVLATLYSEPDYDGHSEALTSSDSYLKDNLIGANTLSSLRIVSRETLPLTPTLLIPAPGQVFEAGDLVPLGWLNGGAALEYQVLVTGGLTAPLTLTWQAEPYQYLSALAQGEYAWQVRGRNLAGEGPWSEALTFTLGAAGALPPALDLPYEADMETQDDWSGTGHWSWVHDAAKAHSGTHSWWYPGSGDYDDGQPNAGILESPPISVTDPGYYLRFWYRYETETYGDDWDQRWVQISVDGEPFTNLLQLHDDPMIFEINASTWLQSPAVDLSEYAGHTVRVRFLFNTVDAANNAYDGWGIDDFSVTNTPPPACTNPLQDDTPVQATLLVYSTIATTAAEICPGGDLDYYTFVGAAGDRIAVDIDADTIGSLLDPYLVLLDSDGVSVLAEQDDEVYVERRDPLLGFTLPHDGSYYLFVRAWNHPSVGGQDYDYSIRLFTDAEPPQVNITWPGSGALLPDAPFTVTAQVIEAVEVNRVDFFWHSSDWLAGVWLPLTTDWDGTDGWSTVFDPVGQLEGRSAAIYVVAYDKAGNWMGDGAWELIVDKTAPESSMEPLAPVQSSTAFMLTWAGSDNLSGIDYYELQQRLDGGAWTDYPVLGQIEGYVEQMWYIGEAGHTYEFRLHAVDYAGNTESYPATAEAITTVPITDVLCATLDEYDAVGDDNSPANASEIVANGDEQWHNFCNPLSPDALNDEDWITITVQTGERYLIQGFPEAAETATVLRLYASDGTTLLAQAAPLRFGEFVTLPWVSDRDDVVYLQVQHLDGRVIGSEVAYRIVVWVGYRIYLPLSLR
jgi:hypothetical protein